MDIIFMRRAAVLFVIWLVTIPVMVYYNVNTTVFEHTYYEDSTHTAYILSNVGIVVLALVLSYMALAAIDGFVGEHTRYYVAGYVVAVVLLYIGAVMSLVRIQEVTPHEGQCGGGQVGDLRNRVYNLSTYGAGYDKHMIVMNVTEIGGADRIHDDDKGLAFMSLWVNGTMVSTRRIGVEMKGRSQVFLRNKFSYGLELWDEDNNGDADTLHEFGFTRKYEDYVIRSHDKLFIHPMAQFLAQPEYYEYTMVDLVVLNGDIYTYEGMYFLVNHPSKRRSIPNNKKAKGSTAPEDATYIFEYEYGTSDECISPHFECKYPKDSKLTGNYSVFLRDMIARRPHVNWTSVARAFVWDQMILTIDMQHRSQIYHVQDGHLNAGPMWDLEESRVAENSHVRQTWALREGDKYLSWYNEWVSTPAFVHEVAVNGSNYIDQYLYAVRNASARVLDMDLSRELHRFPKKLSSAACMRVAGQKTGVGSVSSYVAKTLQIFESRAAWLRQHLPAADETTLKYTVWNRDMPYRYIIDVLIAGVVIGLVVAVLHLASRSQFAARLQGRLGKDTAEARLHLRSIEFARVSGSDPPA